MRPKNGPAPMNNKTEQRISRTYADALVEMFSTWRLIFLVLSALIGMFLIVHYNAEPGTSIEYLGAIKYQKAKPAQVMDIEQAARTRQIEPVTQVATSADPAEDEAAKYKLPANARLSHNGRAIPILDGTLAIYSGPIRNSVQIVGYNVKEISVASRKIDGTETYPPIRTLQGVEFGGDEYIEMEFRKRFFSVELRRVNRDEFSVTVSTLNTLTLKPTPIAKLGTTSRYSSATASRMP